MIRKQYIVKIYDQDGTTPLRTLTTEKPADSSALCLKRSPMFTAQINGGLGECVLDIRAPFDDFSEGTVVDFMNIVTIDAVVLDTDTKTQTITRIYKGYVSQYDPYLEGGEEGVRVTCLGLVSLLSLSYYGTSPNYAVTHTTKDPEFIAKAVIDDFNTVFSGSLLGYAGTTSATGTSITYTFTEQTWLQAITKAREVAGTGWWWAVREDGNLYFKAKPGSATHTFTIGKNVVSLSAKKDSEKVKNEVIVVRSGGTRSSYTDATSQSTYGTGSPATGRRTLLINDSSITDATTANQRGNKAMNDGKDFKIATTLIVDSHYNIESIHIGDTCKIQNFRAASTFFSSNMQIVGMNYLGDTVSLQLEAHTANFGQELQQFVE